MRNLAIAILFSVCVAAAPAAAQEKAVIGGSGAMGDAVDALVKVYKQKHASDAIDVIRESMSTAGGIEGTKIGRLTVGIIGRPVNDKEKKEGLTSRPVARIPALVGVHKSNPIGGLSDAQVCDVFSGKIKSWKDVGGAEGKITVLGRKQVDSSTETVRERMSCFKNLQWSPDAVLLSRGSELLDALNNRPGTVAITVGGPLVMDRPNIKPLAIAGVAPGLDAVKSGKYKYFSEFEFVTLGEPKGVAKRFIDFATSAEGEKVLEKNGITGVK